MNENEFRGNLTTDGARMSTDFNKEATKGTKERRRMTTANGHELTRMGTAEARVDAGCCGLNWMLLTGCRFMWVLEGNALKYVTVAYRSLPYLCLGQGGEGR